MKREEEIVQKTNASSLSFISEGRLLTILERDFQAKLIKELKLMFPGCIVLKNDATYKQGIPDLTIFYRGKWATLECKTSEYAEHQPNQDYYVNLMDEMSFSRFIYPENKESVLRDLQSTFGD